MRIPRNQFTEHMAVLAAVMIATLIAAGIGGWGGFIAGFVIAAPMAIGLLRWMDVGPGRRRVR